MEIRNSKYHDTNKQNEKSSSKNTIGVIKVWNSYDMWIRNYMKIASLINQSKSNTYIRCNYI
jgi:hypothetical protein